jgi:glycerol-3-phosphate dehydrogenase (NAD+)
MRIGLLEMHEFCLEFFEGVKAETFLMESSGVADVITSCELDVGSIIYPSFPSARQIRAGQWSFGSGCSSSVAVLQWCSGAVVQWCSGAVVQWCSGAGVQCRLPTQERLCRGLESEPADPNQVSAGGTSASRWLSSRRRRWVRRIGP